MKTLTIFLLAASVAFAQDSGNRADYASDASYILATYKPASRDHSPEAMAAAANKFLASLDDGHRSKAAHDLKSPERREWTNVPPSPNAGGLRLSECSDDQIKAFCDVLACLLSEQGYAKMCNIMLADDQLIRNEQSRSRFGTESFSVVLFGKPSATQPWAFQLDGHHVGVNLAIQGEKLTMSPSFIGTQPEAFDIASKKVRPLAGEIDDAFKLVGTLTIEQRAKAVVSQMRGRLTTGPGNDARVPDPQGVSCATFDAAQKKLLLSLVGQWVRDLPPKQADQRMKQIEADLDKTYFAWKGPRTAVSDVSYMIQGPTLIIEYACQDLGGNPLDHLHTMYRDPTNEYGKQDEESNNKMGKLYELRFYTTNPGKLTDLHARFRNHTMKLFEKHGMENIIYWNVSESTRGEDEAKDNMLVYIIAHKDEAAREASWKAFLFDPQWKAVAAKSEENGKILAKAPRSILMRATDFSPKDEKLNKDSDAPARLFELRQYNDGPERMPSTVDRFASGEKDLFAKHGMKTVSFWTATDNSAFIYLLAHKDRESSRKSWQGFFPEFREFIQEYRARNQGQDGQRRGGRGQRGAQRGGGYEVRFLIPTDYSPRK